LFKGSKAKGYVLSRLKIAGCHEPIFTDDAFELLFSCSNGCVRQLNFLAGISLISGANQKLKTIDNEVIFQAQTKLNIMV
jgi:type II secretory pathway predicted ATPase ExeA